MSLPNNTQATRVFFDASALFAAVFSETGGARLILRLAESDAIELVLSSQVLAEAEGALRRKAPQALGHLALLLDRAHCQVISIPRWSKSTPGRLSSPTCPMRLFLPLPIGAPGDCIQWLRGQLDTQE